MLDELKRYVGLIDGPNCERCLRMLDEHQQRFEEAWGSSHNHQAWAGGYLGHVVEVMRLACTLHIAMGTIRPLPFTMQDALLVLFLHDLEKPWKQDLTDRTKDARHRFRLAMIAQYGIELTDEQDNALQYVEGEGDDYRSNRRVMNELAAFCHMCDVASARIWHDQPKR